MKNTLVLLFLILFNSLAYSENKEPEVGIYSFSFNRKIQTSGTKVYFLNGSQEYIELQNILNFIGINNNTWINESYTIDSGNIYDQKKIIDLEKKYIYVGGKKIKFTDEIIEKDEKIYAKIDYLPNLLGISNLEKNDEKLIVYVDTTFRLPIELSNIRKFAQEEFKKNEKKDQKKIDSEQKIFEPGNLRVLYDYRKKFQESNYESKNVNAEYLGQLLYGDFETYYRVYPELKNDETRLTYKNVYEGHSLVFGDTTVNLPRVLSGTIGGIRGITFSKDYKLVGEYDNNSLTISGYAPLGKLVELYRDGRLISYEDVKNGQYRFENVPLLFMSDSFYILIYNLDGSITKETLDRYYGEKPEKKGEFGYKFHAGESKTDKYDQVIGEINYGLTKNLTLKTGYYDLKYDAFYSRDNPQYENTGRLGLLYVSDYGKTPYNFEVNSYSNKGEDPDFTHRYNQKYKDYRLNFEGGDYSKNTGERVNKKNDFALDVSKNKFLKDNMSMGLKYYSTEYVSGKRVEEIGTIYRVNLKNIVPEYGYYKNIINGDVFHDFSVRSYFFRDYSVHAGVTHRAISRYDETRYRVEVISSYSENRGIRYKASYERSDKYGDIYALGFDLDYNTWLSSFSDYTKNNGVSNMDTGFTIDKVINLSDTRSEVTDVRNSSIKGIVFIDNNNDEIYDENVDTPLPRTEVKVNGVTSVTNENGEYRISNISSNDTQELAISTQNPLYKGKVDVYKINLNPASTTNLNMPVYPRKVVMGMINFENENLMNKYLKTLYLSIIDIKTSKKIEVIIPETDGFFMVENLIGGEYKISLESTEIPGKILLEKEITLDSKNKELNILINVKGEEIENKKELNFDFIINND
ncbi:MAG: hypothetical protein ACRC54_06385 [Fusobacteriaceae bacterium]